MASISRTGWTVDDLPDLADGPAMIKELGDQVGNQIGAPDCTSTTRPTTGNYAGRLMFETDTGRVIRWSGSIWQYVGSHTEAGVLTHNYGGGIGPVSTNITFTIPFAAPPALTVGCNDPQFDGYYGSLSTTGVTIFSRARTTGLSMTLSVSWIASGR